MAEAEILGREGWVNLTGFPPLAKGGD